MKFSFERFTETENSFAARVTIRRTGQIGFNAGSINRFRVKDFDYCILYFDAKHRVVGMELTSEASEGAIPLKKSDVNTYVRAKNFCDRFAIDYSKSRRYELRKDPGTGYLYFELEKGLTAEEDGGDEEKSV